MKSVSVRLEQELLDKLRIIAAYDGRSVNKEIVMLVKKHIRAYEETHGEICRPPEAAITLPPQRGRVAERSEVG